MKRILQVVLLIFYCTAISHAQTVFKEYVDGNVYVKLKSTALNNASKANQRLVPLSVLPFLKEIFTKYGITKVYRPFYLAGDDDVLPYILRFEFAQARQVQALIDDLSNLKEVEYAEKVRLNKTDLIPNDPLFATTNGSTHLNQINAQSAWNVFNGNSNITVAIIDNAEMWQHADLANNTYTNAIEAAGTTGVDDDHNGYIDDINGYDVANWDNVTTPTNTAQDHGTHCSGIAGACTNNSIGVASIGYGIKVIPVKCSFDNSLPANVDMGYEGILFAVKSKAKIISCSWGNTGAPSLTEQSVIDYAWTRGSIIFASAGNASTNSPNYPGAYNHVFCVAAVNPSDVKSTYSNYGTWVDIAAPGDNITSTTPYAISTATPAYLTFSGTSMATPMVAGLAALMLSKSPGMTRTDVLNCLSSTAANVYTLSGNASYNGQLGAGRIDAFAAMNCAATYSALPPVANFYAFLPNTCPNTPIPFFDSSLYFPTSWSWTFQNGTPATSTSSNPSVQWSTAGTYSVALTVSNANGSNSITKLSYIKVAGPVSLPFAEGFQSSTFLPTNWVANNIWNDNIYWERYTGVGGFGTSTACARFDNYDYNAPGEHDEMRSPKFDFSTVGSARLRFDVAYARYDAYTFDSLEVKLSTNCGTSWTSIYFNGGSNLATSPDQTVSFVPTSTQWRRDSIDISALTTGQGNVMFSFLNHGHYGQSIYLDNINLVFPTPTLVAGSAASICISPAYTFSNLSQGALSYTWNFQGGTPATSTASNPSVSYASPGTYTYMLSATNWTTGASITKTITVLPTLSLSSSSGTYCGSNTYTLNGSGATSYTWSSASGPLANTASLAITPLSNSFYTLSGSNGACSAQSAYTINVIQGPTLSVSNQSICAGASATLTASGASSYSWNGVSGGSSLVVSPATNTNYQLTGSSGGGCVTNKTVSVLVTPIPVSVLSTTNPSCFGSCDGMINASSSGGSAPYQYTTTTGCSSLPCTNLCAGIYTLHVTNLQGCSANVPFTVLAPSPIQPLISVSGASCANCASGSLSVTASGGTAPYSYTWMPSGGNANTASNLLPGCYTVTIADAKGCSTQTSACVEVTTGIPSLSQDASLLIYPNPAKAQVTIEWKRMTFSCSVYNNLGQLIAESKQNENYYQLNLEQFSKGIYLIKVENEKEKIWKKLVVE